MSEKNDSVILELKKKIEEKKALLATSERFSPVTNCSISLFGVQHNINVLDRDGLVNLLVTLNSIKASVNDLQEFTEGYKISGYSVDDWMTDIKAKIRNLNKQIEKSNLRKMEDKLDSLLSSDKKTEFELGELANLLK